MTTSSNGSGGQSPRAFRRELRVTALVGALIVSLLLTSVGANADAAAERAASSTSWQLLLERAEPLYAVENYSEALPFYEQAARRANSEMVAAPDRIHCLLYLADCYCRLDRASDALAQYEQVKALLPASDIEGQITNLSNEALCFGIEQDYSKAETLCRSALKLCSDDKREHLWALARTQAQLGYFDYVREKYLSAVQWFQEAAQKADASGRADLIAELFRQKLAFAQAGSYYHLRRYADAYAHFQRMYGYDVRLFGKTDLQTGWAMLALSDVLGRIQQPLESRNWYQKAIFVFRKVNRDRLVKQYAAESAANPDVLSRINQYVFGNSTIPADLQDTEKPLCADSSKLIANHDPRALYARLFSDAPGRVWLNPLVKQRGIVIAIHGLSLQHSSYDAFATQIADAGYCTVAFDMRGFGTYRQALGAEQLDFAGCLRDVQLVVSAIRADNPGTPLFILGESMGGAIAMQFAAQNPTLADGLIASVPAGKRFKEKRTAARVAVHYLEGKNRLFDIGSDVINQATHDPAVKKEWADDPKTRSALSARELLAFQRMCDRNLEAAKQIDKMPVVIFQGVSDGLIKPESTYDLFRAIKSKDKSFVMVGNTEHLIFEEGCFTLPVLKGVIAWMDSHLKTEPARPRSEASSH